MTIRFLSWLGAGLFASLAMLACASESTSSTECTALANRCVLCPAGELKTRCEATAKGSDTAACRKALNEDQDIRNTCVDSAAEDAGANPTTEPCILLQGRCAKCKTTERRTQCEDAIRTAEPSACRTLLEDSVFSAECM